MRARSVAYCLVLHHSKCAATCVPIAGPSLNASSFSFRLTLLLIHTDVPKAILRVRRVPRAKPKNRSELNNHFYYQTRNIY